MARGLWWWYSIQTFRLAHYTHKCSLFPTKSWQISHLPTYITLPPAPKRNQGRISLSGRLDPPPCYDSKVAQARYGLDIPGHKQLELVQRIHVALEQDVHWHTLGANLISHFTGCFSLPNCRKQNEQTKTQNLNLICSPEILYFLLDVEAQKFNSSYTEIQYRVFSFLEPQFTKPYFTSFAGSNTGKGRREENL